MTGDGSVRTGHLYARLIAERLREPGHYLTVFDTVIIEVMTVEAAHQTLSAA